jgi:hypothetical protein
MLPPKFFYDTEFIEGFTQSIDNKPVHTIQLISIGIVRDDGIKYYAISSEYDYDSSDFWVKQNVIQPLYLATVPEAARSEYSVENFHQTFGKPNSQIAEEIKDFIQRGLASFWDEEKGEFTDNAELYGYYSDYDHVLFCSLFGRMIDLPAGFPMLTIDLKQMLDEALRIRGNNKKEKLEDVKAHRDYPKNPSEHDALADAQWNMALYEFINNYEL